jgi:hypothetical protein
MVISQATIEQVQKPETTRNTVTNTRQQTEIITGFKQATDQTQQQITKLKTETVTKGGSESTWYTEPVPPVVGLPSGSALVGGGGGGGGGSIGGFSFNELLGVKSARDVLFGKSPSRKAPSGKKVNKFAKLYR